LHFSGFSDALKPVRAGIPVPHHQTRALFRPYSAHPRLRDSRQRESVMVSFLPNKNRQRELAAHFDIVLGLTPTA
jgi:hypothetical protein